MTAPKSDEVTGRRELIVSGGVALVVLLALGAFFALRGRIVPVWVSRHSTAPATTP